MILLTILVLTALMLISFIVLIASAGSAMFVIIFSDVIVCVFIIFIVIRHLYKKRH